MRIHDLALGSRLGQARGGGANAAVPPARGWMPLWAHGLGLGLLLLGGMLLLAAAGGAMAAWAWLGAIMALAGAAAALWARQHGRHAADLAAGAPLLQAAIDVSGTALAITGGNGALMAANAAYRRLMGGYPSPLTLDAGGIAAREARICGQGHNETVHGGRALTVTARRFKELPDHLFWELAPAAQATLDSMGLPSADVIMPAPRETSGDGAAEVAALRADDVIPQQVFAQAPMGMALVDQNGDVLRANRALRRLAAIDEAEADFNLLDAIVDGDRAAAKALLEAVETGVGDADPVDNHFTASPDIVSQLLARPAQGVSGDVVLFVKDTTEQKRLELQFAQAQKMQAVGQLAGGIAHDFNNILTAIIGFCDLLMVRHSAGHASFSAIQQIKQNANRAANLVRQLLAFSRKQTLRPSIIDITDALAELSNLLRRLIGENIDLKMVHGRNLGTVRVDQGQLEQVIINLAVNARDAMPSGGTLTIATSRLEARDVRALGHEVMPRGDYVAIEVRDTGQGIPAENLQKIFEPFFTTKEVGKGTGLGLSTVYGIVKQTGGFIFAQSEPGEGASFTIYLPVHAAPAAEATPAPATKAEPVADLWGHGTILLVEDEDPVRTFAHRALSKKGYQVLEAASGEAALALVRAHEGPIDLVISDVVMPNMDGPTLVHEIRALMPAVKVIFISGYAQDSFRDSIAEGVYGFLPKPFSLSQLAEAVKDVLRPDH